jgi:hypothetical protein
MQERLQELRSRSIGLGTTLAVVREALKSKAVFTEDDLQAAYNKICKELGIEPQEPMHYEINKHQDETITDPAREGVSEGSQDGAGIPSGERTHLHAVPRPEGSDGSSGKPIEDSREE